MLCSVRDTKVPLSSPAERAARRRDRGAPGRPVPAGVRRSRRHLRFLREDGRRGRGRDAPQDCLSRDPPEPAGKFTEKVRHHSK